MASRLRRITLWGRLAGVIHAQKSPNVSSILSKMASPYEFRDAVLVQQSFETCACAGLSSLMPVGTKLGGIKKAKFTLSPFD
jgi:hypothetical protein